MPKSALKPIAAGYVRVSRDKTQHGQAGEIVSPETQREFFKKFADMRGFQMPDDFIVEDLDYSGYRMHYSKRPGLVQLLQLAEEGRFHYLLIYKISRLSRRLREFLELYDCFEKAGVGIISVTESIDTSSPYGRAAMHMLAVFAQLQSDELSEYISNTKATQARQGVMPGARAPYGTLRKGGKVLPGPETFPVLRRMFEMAAGGSTGYDIGRWLRAEGVPGPAGGEWWDEEIRRILRNPVYIGKFQFGGEIHDGQHEALIDPQLFYRAQARLAERSVVQADKRNRSLSGVIVCGLCGSLFNVHHGGSNAKDRGYQCRHRFSKGCEAPRVDAPSLEEEVHRRLVALANNPAMLQAARSRVKGKARHMDTVKERARLEAELAKVKKMLETLFEDYHERQIITAEQFAEQNRRYLERAQQAEIALASLLAADPKAEEKEMENRQAALAGLVSVWDTLGEEERARALRQIGLRLAVRENHVEMQLFDLVDEIPGFRPWSTMLFGPAVNDLHYQGRFWSQAQEDYLLANWERQTVEQIAVVLERPAAGVRQKVWSLRQAGKLRSKR